MPAGTVMPRWCSPMTEPADYIPVAQRCDQCWGTGYIEEDCECVNCMDMHTRKRWCRLCDGTGKKESE
jgi:hypothetical protein